MRKKIFYTPLLSALIVIPSAKAFAAGSVTSAAADTVESVRQAHVLRPLEVLGVKNGADDAGQEAVTHISGADVRRYGVESPKGVAEIAPNFYMPDYGSRMTSSIYVRGLGARMEQPVVGLSVDNVPVLNKDAYDCDLSDIADVEVLRGAQAVLNGRNTMGGQINIRTLSPMVWQGYRAAASYGSANAVAVSAGAYLRLNEVLATSLAADYGRSDGFFRNGYDGRRLDCYDRGSLRWKMEWQPSARLSMSNVASLQLLDQGGYPYASLATGEIAYNDTCSYRRTYFADGITLAWAGKRVVVTSRTSVQYLDDDMHLDQDFTTADYFTLRQKRREWTFTEDLFTRGSRGAYSWLGGVFAFYKSTDMSAPVTFHDTGISRLIEYYRNMANPEYPIAWDSRSFVLGSDFKPSAGGVALYHESVFNLGDWRFEAGLRLDFEHSMLDYRSHSTTGYSVLHLQPDGSTELFMHTPVDIDDAGSVGRNFLELLPKVSVSYSAADGRLTPYFTFSKGYKTGGYNTQMFSDVLQQRIMAYMGTTQLYALEDIVSYSPERSFNYELGLHLTHPANKYNVDFTAFYIDCRNQQMTVFPSGMTTGRIMTNAGRTRSFGVELSGRYRFTDDLSLTASYGYTNATFLDYNDGRADYRGRRVPYAPEQTLFAAADWRMPFATFLGVTPSLQASVRGAGRIFWDEANTVKQNFYCLPSLSLDFSAGQWSLRLWCRNLSDTVYDVFYFKSIGNSFVQRGRPREFGATLRLRFGKQGPL